MASFNAYPALGIQDNINQGTISDLNAIGLRSQNALRAGLLPFQLQEAQRGNALGQMQQQLAQQEFVRTQIAQAINDIDETDPSAAAGQWDKNLQKAADAIRAAGGDPAVATQYIGKYTDKRKQNLGAIYGGGSAGGAAPAGRVSSQAAPGGGGLPGNPYVLSPNQTAQMQFGGLGQLPGQTTAPTPTGTGDLPGITMTGEQGQLQRYQQKLQQVAGELGNVLNSSNPQAEWDRIRAEDPEAAKLPAEVDLPKFRQIRAQMQAALDAGGGQQFGAPAERPEPVIKTGAQGEVTSLDVTNPFVPQTKMLQPPVKAPADRDNWQISGYDKDGVPIYFNTATGEERPGTNSVEVGRYRQGNPVGATGGKGTAAERFAADYERIHENDPQYENNPGKLREDAINFGRGFNKPPKDQTDYDIDVNAAKASFGDNRLYEQLRQQFRADRDADRAKAATTSGPKKAAPGMLPNSPMPGPPPEALKYLKANPKTRDKFDQKYGPGASRKYLGQ